MEQDSLAQIWKKTKLVLGVKPSQNKKDFYWFSMGLEDNQVVQVIS